MTLTGEDQRDPVGLKPKKGESDCMSAHACAQTGDDATEDSCNRTMHVENRRVDDCPSTPRWTRREDRRAATEFQPIQLVLEGEAKREKAEVRSEEARKTATSQLGSS
jgi:hypothetical protein